MLKNTNLPVKTDKYKSSNKYAEMAAGPTVSGSSPPVLDEDHMDKQMKDSEAAFIQDMADTELCNGVKDVHVDILKAFIR